jgi:channel protein (hemolysin III family)
MLMSLVTSLGHSIPGFCQPVSALSHLLAAGMAGLAALPLIRLGRGSATRRIALMIYASCVVALLAISGTYHSLDVGGQARAVMQYADYFAIWFLIAGTFTGVHGIVYQRFWRRSLLTFIWAFAVTGIVLQALWFRFFEGVPGLVLYLGCGWIGLASIIKLGRRIGFRAVRPLISGGLFFTAGAMLEAAHQPVVIPNWVGPHEIFHLAVIIGVAIHWRFIRKLLLVHAPAAPAVSVVNVPSSAPLPP